MKRYIPLLGLFFVLFAVFACQDQSQTPDSVVGPLMETVGTDLELTANPYPAEVPPATVEPLEFTMSTIRNFDPEGTITPSSAYAVLPPGGTFDELKEVYLPPGILPEIADIIFAMDLTGSMGGELSNVKMNSVNIMNVLAGAIDDPQFGVMSHMDYNGTFGGCGYTATYGGGTDYPYSLDQGLTTATADVASAINGLSLGWGSDGPENYTRVLYEASEYADWRDDAAKFLLYWQDNVPHDCTPGLDCSSYPSTGIDPGRDNTAGTADDLNLATVLTALDAEGVTLVSLHSGSWNTLWDCYADRTGGDNFPINSNGTIPDGTDIADFILAAIQEVSQDIDVLELRPTAGFEAWFAADPILDVNLADEVPYFFPVDFTVPSDQEPGIYDFDVCVFADGAPLDVCQDVQIVVYDPSAGFVTGGGWINSPAGALNPADPLQIGLPFFQGSYYQLVDQAGISWPDAAVAAAGAPVAGCTSHLVTITSQEEQDALYGFFDGDLQGKWYGGVQDEGETDPAAGWNWVTGEEWDYTNWAEGEPNDVSGTPERYLEGWADGWAWNDEHNLNLVTGYVIEHDQCDLGPTGKANFGFVAKYKKGQPTPDGSTEFQFQAGDINFHSDFYDWLVVTGSNYAKFKGEGTVNGEGLYKFMIWAGDDDPDTFRIKIWEEDGYGIETVLYDNFFDQAIGGGSIVIHTKK